MRCFCCGVLLPIPVSKLYDEKTDRFYCEGCMDEVLELIEEMNRKEPVPESEPEEVPLFELDEIGLYEFYLGEEYEN